MPPDIRQINKEEFHQGVKEPQDAHLNSASWPPSESQENRTVI